MPMKLLPIGRLLNLSIPRHVITKLVTGGAAFHGYDATPAMSRSGMRPGR